MPRKAPVRAGAGAGRTPVSAAAPRSGNTPARVPAQAGRQQPRAHAQPMSAKAELKGQALDAAYDYMNRHPTHSPLYVTYPDGTYMLDDAGDRIEVPLLYYLRIYSEED